MATTLEDGARLLEAAESSGRLLVCAPHVFLSPTYRALHDRVQTGDIGRVLSGRARYGWQGPEWAAWYYKRGGGSIFDLGIYNIMSLCGLLGPVQRVSAMVGTAVATRRVQGVDVALEVDDTAHILMDFGDERFVAMTTGFVIRNMRSPAIELFGEDGVLQLMGEDWAPSGFERWHKDGRVWEIHAETDPSWAWTAGLPHMVECIEEGREPVMRPEHAYHALEISLAATTASDEGRTQAITSPFPELDYGTVARAAPGSRFHHDPRNA
jgi:predicted dehydrogenase